MTDDLEVIIEKVIGAAIEVHRYFGPGSLESTYHRAMEIELGMRGIQFLSEVPVTLDYKSHPVGQGRIDLLIDGRLIVELKAVAKPAAHFKRQVLAYLKSTDRNLGLVINFEVSVLKDGLARVRL